MKCQKTTLKHKSKHRVFLFIVKRKNKIFKQFHQNKFSTVLTKTTFYLRRGNTRREFIGQLNTQYLNTEWRITV